MRVAIATDNGQVASHFGRCQEYTLFDLKDNEIQTKTTLPNPGHAPGLIPNLLAQNSVNIIIAGGMGPRAQGFFQQLNIDTIVGVQGDVDDVIQDFLAGNISTGDNICDHDSPDHKRCGE